MKDDHCDIRWLSGFMLADVERQHQRLGRPDSPPRGASPTFKHTADRRVAIMLSQIGDIARYSYSDKDVEPTHRGYKTPAEEDSSYGHALLQLLAVAAARGVDIEQGVQMALKDIETRGWAKIEQKPELRGIVASWENGILWFDGTLVKSLDEALRLRSEGKLYENMFLHVEHARPEHTPEMLSPHIDMTIAEQGGSQSHAAIICREHDKLCVVGTGKIDFPSGTRVRVWHDGRIEKVN